MSSGPASLQSVLSPAGDGPLLKKPPLAIDDICNGVAQQQQQQQQQQQPPQPQPSNNRRYRLHIRQQPRAGRACCNGKDRRPVDPPPVLQLCIADFDAQSARDLQDLQDGAFMVHCLLRSDSSPARDASVVSCADDRTGKVKSEKQVYGGIDASPFFCDEDPDPATAPPPAMYSSSPDSTPSYASSHHPVTTGNDARAEALWTATKRAPPATFFCFPDISIRKAGVYRLEFQLLRISLDQPRIPVLDSVLSDHVRVSNAKDFDQVQASTPLVRGLVKRGAGFPLKIKQGARANKTLHPDEREAQRPTDGRETC